LRWALAAPEYVARLILVATTPCFVARPDWPDAMAETTLRRFGAELSVSYRLTLQRFVALQVQGSKHARAVLAQLRTQLFARGEPSREVLHEALLLLARTDLRPEAGAISQPAVVVAGERDTLVSSRRRRMALAHASARLVPFDPGCRPRTVPVASRRFHERVCRCPLTIDNGASR